MRLSFDSVGFISCIAVSAPFNATSYVNYLLKLSRVKVNVNNRIIPVYKYLAVYL